jgi:hypothetical protein
MMRTRRFVAARVCAAFVLLVCLLPLARAGIADAPGADLQVSLVTYGPGAIYWERFGHDAIEVRDTTSGEAANFNYGVFDFSQKHFLVNFARGKMRYSMDAEPTGAEISDYIAMGRSVRRQHLALTPAQAAALRDYLLWNLRPENRNYDYDYYTRNCATRVRDALDGALGGIIKAQLRGASPMTFRGETDRLMAAQPWLMLAMDLGLSSYADQPLNQWQASFIPMQLAREIAHVRLPDGRPLVERDEKVATARLPAPPAKPPNLIPPLLIAGLVLGALLAVSGHFRDRQRAAHAVFTVLGSAWLVFAGVIGLALIAVWGLTQHRAGWANENLLLFNPLAFALLAAPWRAMVTRFGRAVVTLVTAAAVFALIAKLIPGFSQHNLPWIGFGLPAWLGLCYALYRRQATRPCGAPSPDGRETRCS